MDTSNISYAASSVGTVTIIVGAGAKCARSSQSQRVVPLIFFIFMAQLDCKCCCGLCVLPSQFYCYEVLSSGLNHARMWKGVITKEHKSALFFRTMDKNIKHHLSVSTARSDDSGKKKKNAALMGLLCLLLIRFSEETIANCFHIAFTYLAFYKTTSSFG